MTQLSQRTLQMVVDHVGAHGSFEAAASHVNMSLSNIYVWRTKSKKDCDDGDTSSPFYINGKWWHELLADARDAFLFGQEIEMVTAEKPEEWIPDDEPATPMPRASYAKPEKPPKPAQSQSELRALAALTPEQRRAKFGASAFPRDASGRRTIPHMSPSLTKDQADDQGHGLRPGPEPFQRPQQPSKYANPNILPPGSGRRVQRLDVGEQIGDGQDQIPSGGFRVA